MDLELYGYWRSSASWRVRIVLEFKGILYKQYPINLVKGEHKTEEYLRINPSALLPALKITTPTTAKDSTNGSLTTHVITQSLAIIELIEDLFIDSVKVIPKEDPFKKAKVLSLTFMIACDTHPVQNLRVLQYVGDEKKAEWAKHFISLGFDGLEKELEKTTGKYCVGDEVSLVDICLVPQVYNAQRWGVDMAKYPIISRINEALSGLPAFQAAHPNKQPDAVL